MVPVLYLLNSRCCAAHLLVALLGAGGCRDARHGAPPAGTEAELHDDYGHVVRLVSPPRRIVSLNPATTELLFALGAGDRVVGRTQYDLWPDSARLVPSVGAGMQPNLEAVLGRKPDLVVMYASGSDRGAHLTLARHHRRKLRDGRWRHGKRRGTTPHRPPDRA